MSTTTTTALRRKGRIPSPVPTLRHERALLRDGHRWIAGMDEVGRGALAGPVTVGVVLVDLATRTAPTGLRDSKLLTPDARGRLLPRLRRWAPRWAVGHAEADEIDRIGIIAGLRLAGRRALAQVDVTPSLVLLDGSHDWLSAPQPTLFDAFGPDELDENGLGYRGLGLAGLGVAGLGRAEPGLPGDPGLRASPSVRTMVKADRRCASVAAASVFAKTTRDALMVHRASEHPGYGWDVNKGYSAPAHVEAIASLGACPQHRLSWRLPGMMDLDLDLDVDAELEIDDEC